MVVNKLVHISQIKYPISLIPLVMFMLCTNMLDNELDNDCKLKIIIVLLFFIIGYLGIMTGIIAMSLKWGFYTYNHKFDILKQLLSNKNDERLANKTEEDKEEEDKEEEDKEEEDKKDEDKDEDKDEEDKDKDEEDKDKE